MNFYIFTVHNSRNAGSFLQAKALGDFLQKYGNVSYVDTKARNMTKYMLESLVRSLAKGDFNRASYEWKRSKSFLKRQKEFHVVEGQDVQKRKDSICIFGSDEIWNIDRVVFSKYPIFWGKGFEECTLISYAPSVNNASAQQLKEYGAKEYLEYFTAISVRDTYSRDVLSTVTKKGIAINIDPTFLYDKTYYLSNYKSARVPYEHYIAVYCIENKFENRECDIKAIQELARKLNLKTVSVGMYNKWCDLCVTPDDVNPFVLYEKAEYVITNTFHGTAFAITFKKQFAVLMKHTNRKVTSLLEEFGLQDRYFEKCDMLSFCKKLEEPIDYEIIQMRIQEKRNMAEQFLMDAISGIIC